MNDSGERAFWFLPVLVLGLYALAPGLLNIWLVWFSWDRGLEITRGQMIFAANGLIMSLLPAALCFVPVARSWFLRRRETWPAEAFLWQIRVIVAGYVLYRCQAKFADVPLPDAAAALLARETLYFVFGVFVAATMLPGRYATLLARRHATPLSSPSTTDAGAQHRAAMPPEFANNPLARAAFRRDAEIRVSSPASGAVVVRSGAGDQGVSGLRKAGLAMTYPLFFPAAFGCYAIYPPSFVPSEEVLAMGARFGWGLTFAVGAVCFVGLWISARTAHEVGRRQASRAKAALFSAILAPLIGVSTPAALFLGAPALHSHLASPREPAELIIVVARREDGLDFKRCNWRAETELTVFVFDIEVCGVPETLHATLKPGDRLRLLGYRTDYGVRYDRIEAVVTPIENGPTVDRTAQRSLTAPQPAANFL